SSHLCGQLRQQRSMVPRRVSDEGLQTIPRPIVKVRHRLHVLTRQIRQQALDVHPRIGTLLRTSQAIDNRVEEHTKFPQHVAKQIVTHLGISQQLLSSDLESTLHRLAPRRKSIPRKEPLRNRLQLVKNNRQ